MPLSSQPAQLVVHLYSDDSPYLYDQDEDIVVENLCKLIAQHVGIRVMPFPLFGLVDSSHKIWLCPHKTITLSQYRGQEFYFRMRYRLPTKKLQYLVKKEPKTVEYIYYQCRSDLLKERTETLYKGTIDSKQCLGLGVLERLCFARHSSIDPKDVKTETFKKSVPKSSVPSSKNPLTSMLEVKRFNNIFSAKLMDLHQDNLNTTKENLWVRYINALYQYVPSYLIETYNIIVCRNDHQEVRIIAVPPNDYIEDIGFIKNLKYISLRQSMGDNPDTWNIIIGVSDEATKMMSIKDRETAESFVSLLIGYYRLTVSYYFSPCDEMVAPSLTKLRKWRCHGPMHQHHCDKIVKEKGAGWYLLRQSITFDLIDLLYWDEGSPNKVKKLIIVCLPNGQLRLQERPEVKANSPTALLKAADLADTCKYPIRCEDDENHGLLLCCESEAEDEEGDTSDRRPIRNDVPFLDTADFDLTEPKKLGDQTAWYTAVYEGSYQRPGQDRVRVAVKRLREDIINNLERLHCLEPFMQSVDQLKRMRSGCIVGLMGVSLCKPFSILLEYAGLGSLDKYLQMYHTLTKPASLLTAMLCILQALQDLEQSGLVHGNIRCKNVLVLSDDPMTVKLGDPGMTYLYNTLKLDHLCNQERMPWLAPELHRNLSAMTTRSDLFAFGTTVWEMWSHGRRPPENAMKIATPLDEVVDPPVELSPCEQDMERDKRMKAAVLKVLMSCWSQDPNERGHLAGMYRDISVAVPCFGLGKYYTRLGDPEDSRTTETTEIEGTGDTARSQEAENAGGVFATPQPSGNTTPCEPPSLSMLFNLTLNIGDRSGVDVQSCAHPNSVGMAVTNGFTEHPPAITGMQGAVNINVDILGRPLPTPPVSSSPSCLAQCIWKKNLRKGRMLGEGYFGNVYKGEMKPENGNVWKDCAIKELKPDHCQQIDDAEKEFDIMCNLQHENVVKVYGYCLQEAPYSRWLVMEYVRKGCLRTILPELKNDVRMGRERLFKICRHVALGMDYLASKKVVHRDLAVRNVLITDDYTAKITDFGLARALDNEYQYKSQHMDGGVFPIHYYAPESLFRKLFTEKGDVWSYGILLWEVYSFGAKKPEMIKCKHGEDSYYNLYRHLEQGHRLSKPEECPELADKLIRDQCWQFDADARPKFKDIVEYLNKHELWK